MNEHTKGLQERMVARLTEKAVMWKKEFNEMMIQKFDDVVKNPYSHETDHALSKEMQRTEILRWMALGAKHDPKNHAGIVASIQTDPAKASHYGVESSSADARAAHAWVTTFWKKQSSKYHDLFVEKSGVIDHMVEEAIAEAISRIRPDDIEPNEEVERRREILVKLRKQCQEVLEIEI